MAQPGEELVTTTQTTDGGVNFADLADCTVTLERTEMGVSAHIVSPTRSLEIDIADDLSLLQVGDVGTQLRTAAALGGSHELILCARDLAERIGTKARITERTEGQELLIRPPEPTRFQQLLADARMGFQRLLVKVGFSQWDILDVTEGAKYPMPEGVWGSISLTPRFSFEVYAGAQPFNPPIFELNYFDHGRPLRQTLYGYEQLNEVLRQLARTGRTEINQPK